LVVPFVLYVNILRNDYSIDDSYVTKKTNMTARGIKAIPKIFTSFYINEGDDHKFDYRPMVKVSFAIEHQFFGVSPVTSHLFNILFYLICLLLAYKFLTLLVNEPGSKIPFYITLLFAVMPIHTEVVASLKNRDILLCFIFTFSAAILILKGFYKEKGAWINYLSATILIFLSLLSKLDVLPFFAIIPAIAFFKFKINVKGVLIYICTLAVILVALRFTRRFALDGMSQSRIYYYFENPLFIHKDFSLKLIALFNCLGFYLIQCVLPLKQSCYYGADTILIDSISRYGIVGIISSCAILYGLYYSFRKKKTGLFLGLFMFCASLSMYLNFLVPSVGIVADRFTFFASLGFCMSLIFLLQEFVSLDKKITVPVKVMALVILLIYGFMAISRNADWKSSINLIVTDIKKYPNSAYLNYLQGINMMDSLERKRKNGTQEEKKAIILSARKSLEKSLAISGDYPNSLNLLSYVLVFLDRDYKAGLEIVNRDLAIKKTTELVFSKAVCLHFLKADSAEYYLKETIRLDSTSYNAYQLLMEKYNTEKKYDKTIEMFNGARKRGVENETILTGLASTYWQMNDTLSTEFYCEKILSLNPENKDAKKMLGILNNSYETNSPLLPNESNKK